jgi:ribonucleoside-diphosphate reductase alpha chain
MGCFLALMERLEFLPNSPTLMNAGRDLQQLSACFVLPVPDSIEGIFEAIKETAVIHQSGGGTGFAFSRLRPRGDRVRSTMGVASGPVSFLKVFDAATEAIKQGGTRRGANMGILAVTHPDIEEFIALKSDMRTLTNFNISVAITEEFMEAVEADAEFELVNPKDDSVARSVRARHIFNLIVENAGRTIRRVFIDRINRDHPTPHLGPIGRRIPARAAADAARVLQSWLAELAAFVKTGGEHARLDWERWRRRSCNGLLPRRRPTRTIDPGDRSATKATRKIGLGVMYNDTLIQLRIPYDSEEALELGAEVMALSGEGQRRLAELARERGTFPAWKEAATILSPVSKLTRTTVADGDDLDHRGRVIRHRAVFAWLPAAALPRRTTLRSSATAEVNKHSGDGEGAAGTVRRCSTTLRPAVRWRSGTRAVMTTASACPSGLSAFSRRRTRSRRSGTFGCRRRSSGTRTMPSRRPSTSRSRRRRRM